MVYMINKIQKYFKTIFDNRSENEKLAIEFSNKIQILIGMNPSEFKTESYEFNNWKIVSARRRYSEGWVSLFEAYPRGYSNNIGYVNSRNPDWIEIDGTATVVIMPSYPPPKFGVFRLPYFTLFQPKPARPTFTELTTVSITLSPSRMRDEFIKDLKNHLEN